MNRAEVLDLLARNKPTLVVRYGVDRLALFGSTVRDAARADSDIDIDIDILVSFDGPATSERYFGVQFFLEEICLGGQSISSLTRRCGLSCVLSSRVRQSMSEPVGREWRFYIDDMIAFAEKVVACTNGLDQQAFVASDLVYDATLRNLELIGEAAGHMKSRNVRAEPARCG